MRLTAFLTVLFPSLLLADAGWMLTTADFAQQPVSFQSISPTGLGVLPVGSQEPAAIPFDRFLQLDRSGAVATPAEPFLLYLVGGDRLYGRPIGYKLEQVIWKNPLVGELTIPLKQVRGLVRQGRTIENLDARPLEDTIQLANGDSIKGILTNITDTKITINSNASDVDLPIDGISTIHFAPAGQSKLLTGRAFRVQFNDGSVITAASLQGDGTMMTLALDGGPRPVDLARIIGIEQLNGPVAWLSSLAPLSVTQTPYFGDLAWPTKMDQTVLGRPIRFGSKTYARGIGVHSRSRIEYALDGSYKAFRTQYAIAIDGRNQFADATIRIQVDGKTIHEYEHLRAGTLSPVVVVDLPADAKVLALEVDYGAANDAQDHVNWIEPALLRTRE